MNYKSQSNEEEAEELCGETKTHWARWKDPVAQRVEPHTSFNISEWLCWSGRASLQRWPNVITVCSDEEGKSSLCCTVSVVWDSAVGPYAVILNQPDAHDAPPVERCFIIRRGWRALCLIRLLIGQPWLRRRSRHPLIADLIPEPCSQHVRVSSGKIMNPKLLPKAPLLAWVPVWRAAAPGEQVAPRIVVSPTSLPRCVWILTVVKSFEGRGTLKVLFRNTTLFSCCWTASMVFIYIIFIFSSSTNLGEFTPSSYFNIFSPFQGHTKIQTCLSYRGLQRENSHAKDPRNGIPFSSVDA